MSILNNRDKRENAIYYATLLFLTSCIGYISLGRGFDFDIYNGFEGDGIFGMMLTKTIKENGPLGVWFNQRLAAPETETLIDYPVLGNVMVLLLWVISWFTESVPRIMYTYLILTFALDGLSMSLLLRKLKIRRSVSFVVSCLFATAPFHFYRYLWHSSLINYMFIPIAIYLSLVIIDVLRNEAKWKLVTCAVILGLGYGYYYAFGLIIMSLAFLINCIQSIDKRKALEKIWIIILVLGTVLITLLPKMLYSFFYGKNFEAGKRAFIESEIYGLKIINLLLPVQYSKIGFLQNITNIYANSGAPLLNENSAAGLGMIGVVGFASLCVFFVFSFVQKKENDTVEKKIADFLCLETIAFLLTASIGGFGEIFNWVVTAQIRCYNRCSIVITCFSLIMIALMLDRLFSWKRIFAYSITGATLLIGLFDQVNIQPDNWQEEAKKIQAQYQSFFSSVEKSLNESAMIYQLPYMDFPEAGAVNGMNDYKPFIGYLFSDDLKWSYGAVRGRNDKAKQLNIDDGMSYSFVRGLQKEGFQAVYIDINGYADGGKEILEFYNQFGIEPIVSEDKTLYVYNISNINISDKQLLPGYSLIYDWNMNYDWGLSEDKMAENAAGLVSGDGKTLLNISEMFLESGFENMNNMDFVYSLYTTFLQREPDEGGKISWAAALESGTSRTDVIAAFLRSDEFRCIEGF